ncbi:hypothetical protein ACHAXA_000123 [Cyclostephanos tholiformis]|uniref:DUF6824 domain-containing protein n=1 Tax=Cyclostephanos tholiformis TaxID=382380 RepID=A0ABD3RXV5_9STRA
MVRFSTAQTRNFIDSLPPMDEEFFEAVDKISPDESLQWMDSFDDTKLDSIEPLPWRIESSTHIDCPTVSTTPSDCQSHNQETASQPISAPDRFDVVGGRGQCIQRLPGNETYRKLVSVNKRIYARCHKKDKGKVSQVGGRFLEYDEPTRTYHENSDKRASMKTSQALREGLSTIRKQIYSDLAAGRCQSWPDANLLGTSNVPLPAERYFEYSVRYLQVHLKNEFPSACEKNASYGVQGTSHKY